MHAILIFLLPSQNLQVIVTKFKMAVLGWPTRQNGKKDNVSVPVEQACVYCKQIK